MSSHPFADVRTISEFLGVWLRCELLAPELQRELRDYYKSWSALTSRRLGYWYDSQVREMERYLYDQAHPRVLEVGVGCGTESLWFAWLGGNVVGIDSMAHCVALTRARLAALEALADRRLDCRIERCSITDLEAREEFDLIWLEQAFHHMEPRAQVVKRLAGALKPGGRILLSEANALNPLLQALLIKRRGFKKVIEINTADGPGLWGNERVVSAPGLAQLFRREGIHPVATRYFRVLPAGRRFEAFFPVEKLLGRLAGVPLLWPIFTHYNYVGQKVR